MEPLAESIRGELGQPLGLWSRGYRGSEAPCIPAVKVMLTAYQEVPAALGVLGTEAPPGILIFGAGLDVQRMVLLHIMQLMLCGINGSCWSH